MQPTSAYSTTPKRPFPVSRAGNSGDGEWLVLVSPLDIDGVTVEGLQFRATALLVRRDESITFQLEYFPRRRQPKGGPMERIEWRPLRGHNNKLIGPLEHRNKLQRGSHHHEFRLNWEHSKTAVRKGDLPLSVPIQPEPSYDEILVFVGKAFRISPIDWVPPPPWAEWQPSLL